MLWRIWDRFKRWGWAKRTLLVVVAPWLVLLAWMVTTGKPRWASATVVGAAACAWILIVANVGGPRGSGSVAAEPTTKPPSTELAVPTPAAGQTTTSVHVQPAAPVSGTAATVSHVTDGDTLTLADGRTVRLAQVDAPETNDCFGSESTAALRALADGATVELRRPPEGPEKDQYGRTLAEVTVGEVSANEALVLDGAAEWYDEYAQEDADLAQRLQAAEVEARAAGRGLWSACYPSETPATTVALPPPALVSLPAAVGACDPAYPDVCIPPPPPDLDCGSIPFRRFRVVEHPDPHNFDADDDGIGCESD